MILELLLTIAVSDARAAQCVALYEQSRNRQQLDKCLMVTPTKEEAEGAQMLDLCSLLKTTVQQRGWKLESAKLTKNGKTGTCNFTY